jgi:hypothetical protein
MRCHACCALAALLPALAFATPAQAGTASLGFPAASVAGEGELVNLVTTLAPGEPLPSVRVHAPGQPTGCTSRTSDPGATIPVWAHWEGTTVEGGDGPGGWQPQDVGTYEFCVYFADGTFVDIDRQVVPPLTFTLTVTPGKSGSPTNVALNGTLAASLAQTYGIELKYRAAGGLPCSLAPSAEPGTPIPVPQDSLSVNYWLVETIDPNLDIAFRGDTAPLAAGTYLLCMWEGPINVESRDLTQPTLATSTTFVVDSPPPNAPPPASGAAPSASATRTLPRNVAPPSLTGRFRVGSIVHCSTGRWSSPPTISAYRWYRGTQRIARASSATYRITRLDSGRRLRCQVVVASGARQAISKASASHAVANMKP